MDRDIIFAFDDWVCPPLNMSTTCVKISDLAVRQQDIAHWRKGNVHIAPEIAPFLLNWSDSRATTDCWHSELPNALTYLPNHGSERDRVFALNAIDFDQKSTSVVGRRKSRVVWGPAVSLSDCWIVELVVGRLHFHLVDYVDSVPVNEKLQGLLEAGR